MRIYRRQNLVIVLAIALAVGALTSVFSVLNSELLRPFPYPHSERLVEMRENVLGFHSMSVALPDYQDWTRVSVFASMGAYRGFSGVVTATGDSISAGEEVHAFNVSSSLLPLLGARPILGHGFTIRDDVLGSAPKAILSYALWRGRFGASRAVLGRMIRMEGRIYTVVGVAPKGFDFPAGADLWVSLGALPPNYRYRTTHQGLDVIAQLLPNTSLNAARAAMATEMHRLAAAHPADKGESVVITPYLRYVSGVAAPALWAALAASVLVLLIACLNVTMLLSARGRRRRAEFAVRAALGAHPRHLVVQQLTEALGLAIAGGAAGVGVAMGSLRVFGTLLTQELPRHLGSALDWRVLGLVVLAILATGAISATMPAWRASRADPAGALEKTGAHAGSGVQAGRQTLVVAEIALALPLAAVGALLFFSLQALLQNNPGYNLNGTFMFVISLPASKYRSRAAISAFHHVALQRLSHLPGVAAAGMIKPLPLSGNMEVAFTPAERPLPRHWPLASAAIASAGVFRALGITVFHGRSFVASDGTPPYGVMVDRGLARRYWPGRSPIGKELNLGFPAVIVGVFRHMAIRALDGNTQVDRLPQILLPVTAQPQAEIGFVLRAAPGFAASALATASAHQIHRLDPGLPLLHERTGSEVLARALAQRQLALDLCAVLAALALLLAGLGIFAALADSLAQRQHEFGVRVALGATPRGIAALIFGETLRLVAAGAAIGLVLSLLAGHILASFLFRTPPVSLWALGVGLAATLAITLAAAGTAVSRATEFDAAALLRSA